MKTFQKQIFPTGEDKSTYLQEDSRASRSALQGSEKERKITAISGHRCSVQYERYDQLGLLVKMLLESSRWFSPARRLKWDSKPLFLERMTEKEYCTGKNTLSKPSAEILSVKDIQSSRLLFRLVPSERPTGGTEFGLLPTVQTQGMKVCNAQGKTVFMPLKFLPTPNAAEGTKFTKKYNLNSQMGRGLTAMAINGMLPTPIANSWKTPCEHGDGSPNLQTHVAREFGKTFQLNPRFVAEMMGFPPDWTELPFLNGDKNP